jgi:hypothetical protein
MPNTPKTLNLLVVVPCNSFFSYTQVKEVKIPWDYLNGNSLYKFFVKALFR